MPNLPHHSPLTHKQDSKMLKFLYLKQLLFHTLQSENHGLWPVTYPSPPKTSRLLKQTPTDPPICSGGQKVNLVLNYLKLHCSPWIWGSTDVPSQEGWEVWFLRSWKTLLIDLLEKVNQNPSWPIQRHCTQLPCNATKTCQPQQCHNIQSFEKLGVNCIHPRWPYHPRVI